MRVLVVAAHPDDELLGVGGTLAKHAAKGDEVVAVVASEGATARYDVSAKQTLQDAGRAAARVLGMQDVRFLGMPDQRMDTLPILDVIQRVEREVDAFRPEVVYTHHWGDVNRDHRVVAEAIMIACRPIGDTFPKRVLAFETPSASEWNYPDPSVAFVPNHFVDITDTLEKKLAAMACYETELRPAPHPRSLEALRSRAEYWGQVVTRRYAEAFVVLRQVE